MKEDLKRIFWSPVTKLGILSIAVSVGGIGIWPIAVSCAVTVPFLQLTAMLVGVGCQLAGIVLGGKAFWSYPRGHSFVGLLLALLGIILSVLVLLGFMLLCIASMGMRPASDTFKWEVDCIIGLICLAILTWVIVRRLKETRLRRRVLLGSVLIAVLAAITLREEFHVYRVERCFRTMQWMQRNPEMCRGANLGTENWVSIDDGVARSPYGDSAAVCRFLRKKYSNWFSGSVIRVRNMILGWKSPTEAEMKALELDKFK